MSLHLFLKEIPGVWLLWVMALTPAIRDIKQRFPRSVVRTFIDDRTFVSPTAVEVCDVRGAWDEWSTKLGLTENRDKTAIFHAKATGQRALRAKGVVPDPCPKILGVELQGIKQRANTSRRINESKNQKTCPQKVHVCLSVGGKNKKY